MLKILQGCGLSNKIYIKIQIINNLNKRITNYLIKNKLDIRYKVIKLNKVKKYKKVQEVKEIVGLT